MKKIALALGALSITALTACGPVQSPECAKYIECQTAVDAEAGTTTADTLDDAYGAGGTCWTTTAEAAQACTDACVSATEALATGYPDIAECAAE